MAKRLHCPYFFYSRDKQEAFLNFITPLHPEIGVIASMNHLLPAVAFSIPPLGFINLHPSLLPDLPGPHVWTWLYYYNDRLGGVTIHQVDSGEDSGPILKQAAFPIFPGMNPGTLIKTAIHLGTSLLLDVLQDIQTSGIKPIPTGAPPIIRRARRLKKGENLFPFTSWDLEHTYHFLQGARPWYSPFKLKQKTLGILDWKAASFSTTRVNATHVGFIHWDRRGFYFAHPQGKIHLKLQASVLHLVCFSLLLIAVINLFLGK